LKFLKTGEPESTTNVDFNESYVSTYLGYLGSHVEGRKKEGKEI
jgi:hypothetical protein